MPLFITIAKQQFMPTNIEVSCVNGQYTITWDPFPGAVKYKFVLNDTNDNTVVSSSSKNYFVIGLSEGVGFTFSIYAVDADDNCSETTVFEYNM